MEIAVQFTAKLPVKLTKRAKWYVASCPILDTHSQGDTEEQAKDKLGEALSLFFISCFERGTLEAVLKKCGFKAARPETNKGMMPTEPDGEYINVPIPFLVDPDSEKVCHA